MSDSKHNKDPVEQFFRKQAQDYHIPYREDDWLKLEQKLDLLAAQRIHRKRMIWMAAASLLIISMLTWATIENRLRIKELRMQMADSQQQAPQPETELQPFTGVPPDQDRPDQDQDQQAPDFHVHDAPAEAPADASTDAPTDASTDAPTDASTDAPTDAPADATADAIADDPAVYPSDTPFEDPVVRPRPAAVTHEILARMPEPDPVAAPSRLAVGIRLSPVYSTAGSPVNAYESGYGAGLSLEYRLTSRLTVATGAGYSVVRYSATGNDYALSASNFPGQQITDMSGECRILDIPVTIQLRLFEFERSRVFGTAGLLTYVMLNEAYTFKTGNYYQNSASDIRWQERTGTWHWFSNAGFSVGYERDLHRNWSLRAEPYVRVPVREVGWASVRLYTIGTMFSIQYRL